MRLTVLAALALAAFALAAASAAAQPTPSTLRPTDERVATAGGYFTYFLPGERTSQVSVLGAVRAPGLYVVSEGTDLGEIIALAGGPESGARTTEVERTVTIRLFRTTAAGTREVVYARTAEAFARDADGYPQLYDGDTVDVDVVDRRLRTYRDTLSVITAVSTLVIIGIQVVTLL